MKMPATTASSTATASSRSVTPMDRHSLALTSSLSS
jgi:hypothetical protein